MLQSLFHRVLLVEDDPSHQLLIKRALSPLCGELVVAGTVREAEAIRRAAPCDLIVTDMNLPDGSGPELVARLSNDGVPVVVLTSSNSVEAGVEAMKLGARDFLVKNFDHTFRDVLGLSISRVFAAVALETERRRLERDVKVLHQAIERGADAFAIVESSGSVTYHNAAFKSFCESFGGTTESLLSCSPDGICQGKQLFASVERELSRLIPGGVWHTELLQKGKDASAYDLSLSAIGDGNERRLVVWIRDIRDLKRREKLQKELLSTTTHDLKGPLGAISLSCDVLLSDEVPVTKTRDLIQRIASSATSAINLIEELLSARRIEEGTFVLRPVPNDVAAVARSVLETWSVNAVSRSVTLDFDCPEQVHGTIDRLGFERVLTNLVSNALKFTPKGGSVIVQVSQGSDGIELRVSDTGQGMDSHEVKQLFHRFSRLERHSGTHGSGLGLFIVKTIVDAHGGGVEVSSQPGKGTTFLVRFPVSPPHDTVGEVQCLTFG
jgi:signal transduction histidine kinase/ActR/RegA family two-component response regulator